MEAASGSKGTSDLPTRMASSNRAVSNTAWEDWFAAADTGKLRRWCQNRAVQFNIAIWGDDIFQDTCVELMLMLRDGFFDPQAGNIMQLAFHVARWRAAHYSRRNRPHLSLTSIEANIDEGEIDLPDSKAARALEMAEVREALRKTVSVKEMQALLLTDYYGLSSKEAAEVMGVTPECVRTSACRARTRLREVLQDRRVGN